MLKRITRATPCLFSKFKMSTKITPVSQQVDELINFVESLSDYNSNEISTKIVPQNPDKFYLTTAIFYTNGSPHIGHVYEAVTSDIIARYHRTFGREVFFLTGTDEHGQKIAKVAEDANLTPKQLCDKNVVKFKNLCSTFNISNDLFIRTTDDYHYTLCQKMFEISQKNGDIYLSRYEGYYNPREEQYITDNEAKLNNYIDPVSKKPYERHSEEAYFFKLSKYQNKLINHINNNIEFIQPDFARQQILTRLKEPLRDLCISRTTLNWGVPVPNDDKHVLYVWFDALNNYLSGIDYLKLNGNKSNKNFWPCGAHIIGKDIVWFHTVYWPCMLYSFGVELPKTVFCHGFVNDKDGNKMSKSIGNVVDPFKLLKNHSVDSVRYFIATQCKYGDDMRWDNKQLKYVHDADLTKQFGNFVNRALNLCQKYCNSKIPKSNNIERVFNLNKFINEIEINFKNFDLSNAAYNILERTKKCNNWIHEKQPWKEKNEGKRINCIRTSLECIFILAHFFEPFIPESSNKVFKYLNTKRKNIKNLNNFNNLIENTKIINEGVLFKQHHKTHITKQINANKPDLANFNFVIGKIINIKNHPKNNNSYIEDIDIGEPKPRQIVSGLAKYCTKEELLNSYVIIFSNLKSANFQSIKSHGMVLCALKNNKIKPIRPPNQCIIGERLNWSKQDILQYKFQDSIKIKTKKKNSLWETIIKSKLNTNDKGQMCFEGHPFTCKNGFVTSDLINAQIS